MCDFCANPLGRSASGFCAAYEDRIYGPVVQTLTLDEFAQIAVRATREADAAIGLIGFAAFFDQQACSHCGDARVVYQERGSIVKVRGCPECVEAVTR